MDLADGGGQLRRGQDGADAPAGDGVGLRGPGDGHCALGHARQRGQGDVPALVDDVLVDLVGDGIGAVPLAEGGDARQLVGAEDLPRGVVGRVQDEGPGPRSEGPGQPVQVQGLAHGQRHGDGPRAAEHRVRAVVLVPGLEDDHFLPRVHQGQQHCRHGLRGAAGDRDLGLGIHGQAVAVLHLAGQGLAQPLRAPGDGVLVDVRADGRDGGFLERLRGREVGEALGQVDGAMLVGEPRHPPDDRLGEAVRARRRVHEPPGQGTIQGSRELTTTRNQPVSRIGEANTRADTRNGRVRLTPAWRGPAGGAALRG